MDDKTRTGAKIICSSPFTTFCRDVGGSLGCKNGRGECGPHVCIATDAQLMLCGYWDGAASIRKLDA